MLKRIILTYLILSFTPAGALLRDDDKAAPETPPNAVLFLLKDQLSETMPMTLARAIDKAESIQASHLIIEIDTPGGQMLLMEQLRDLVFEANRIEGLETVAFINVDADSAGALIAIACDTIYMSNLGHIGSATPVSINPLAPLIPMLPKDLGQDQEDMMRKVKSSVRAKFRATAVETGRNPDIAEAMVDPDIELVSVLVENEIEQKIMTRRRFNETVSRLGQDKVEEFSLVSAKGELLNMTAREAKEWKFIDGIRESREELLSSLGIEPGQLQVVGPSWSEQLVSFIESIYLLLLIAGLVLLFVEYQIPGFGIPGILGLSCLAILFLSKWLAGLAEVTEILMIILGGGLLAVEIFVIPGTFITGILGAIMIGAGLVLSFQPFILPETPWETELLQDNIVNLSIAVIAVLVSTIVLTKFLPRVPFLNRFILDTRGRPNELHGSAGAIDDVKPDLALAVGDRGVAHTFLRPSGKVMINGALLDAQSEGDLIELGEGVVVIRITGNFIFVRKCEGKQP